MTVSQFDLVRRVVITSFSGIRKNPELVQILAGPAAGDVFEAVVQKDHSGQIGLVEIELTLLELHAIYSILSSAYVKVGSEEAFYMRNGFFSEHVQGVVWAIDSAMREL
ncbi:hypothetical protein NI17_005540 [Thermobifida halotolerans]|uniref:Uncharacterized protein n=1 Tax=Thermobifida halotolerans TaxID=483545 RepID=A0AA97LZ64_9ACTN|nr:hypothetical protein [Thermobifida halotolerans]UOE20671.1 hypothetical protein NI17_005540 [Thermobifida halotolerans]